MKRVTGIGGIFFTCPDVEATKKWYQKHLGLNTDQYGCTFYQAQAVEKDPKATQQWSPFPADTQYFDPKAQEFMVNYRVADLEALLADLKSNGVRVVGEMQEFDYGKFGWVLDCDDRKIELWEPANEHLFEK